MTLPLSGLADRTVDMALPHAGQACHCEVSHVSCFTRITHNSPVSHQRSVKSVKHSCQAVLKYTERSPHNFDY